MSKLQSYPKSLGHGYLKQAIEIALEQTGDNIPQRWGHKLDIPCRSRLARMFVTQRTWNCMKNEYWEALQIQYDGTVYAFRTQACIMVIIIHSPCHFNRHSRPQVPLSLLIQSYMTGEVEPCACPHWHSSRPVCRQIVTMDQRLAIPGIEIYHVTEATRIYTKNLQKRQLVRRFRGRVFDETRLARIAEEDRTLFHLHPLVSFSQ